METKNILILVSATFLLITSVGHSVFGEKMLIAPLLKTRQGVLKVDLARVILRFGWHITSISWLVLATILVTFVFQPARALHWALLATGISFTAIGIYDVIASRARHVGWPALTGIGVSSLAALFLS